jgi:alkylation response protein AidB-like acyl-CoA dehydrogenase
MPGCWRAPDGPGAQPDIGVAVRDHHRCGSDGSHYVLNGLKTFISNGSHCDLLIATKADLSAGAAGISQAGRVRARTSSGEDRQHGQETYELFFSGMEQLACQRLIIAALCASVAESAVLEVIRYTKHREDSSSRSSKPRRCRARAGSTTASSDQTDRRGQGG